MDGLLHVIIEIFGGGHDVELFNLCLIFLIEVSIVMLSYGIDLFLV